MRRVFRALAAPTFFLAWVTLTLAQTTDPAPPSDNPAPGAWYGGFTLYWVLLALVAIAVLALIWRVIARRRTTRL